MAPQEIIIPSNAGDIRASYRPGNPIVVFSHGFGVESTSNGLFSDIASTLPAEYGYIRFNYYAIDSNTWNVPGLTDMVIKLQSVIEYALLITSDVRLIAHSQGCTVASLAKVTCKQILFLAPPTRTISTSFKDLFVSKRAGRARIDSSGNVHLVRKSDSKELIISTMWFSEMVNNTSFEMMLDLCRTESLHVIEALRDESIKDRRKYRSLEKSGAHIIPIDADHNFTLSTPRDELQQTILTILGGA